MLLLSSAQVKREKGVELIEEADKSSCCEGNGEISEGPLRLAAFIFGQEKLQDGVPLPRPHQEEQEEET